MTFVHFLCPVKSPFLCDLLGYHVSQFRFSLRKSSAREKKQNEKNSDRTKQKDLVGLSALEVVLFHLIKAHLSPNTLRLKLRPELVEALLSAIPDKENTATIIHGEMIRARSP